MKNVFLCWWLGFCAGIPLFAQNEDGGGPHEAKGRVAWFVSTSMPEGLENPVSVMTGKEIIPVTLSRRSPSDPVKIPADGILRIVRKVVNPEAPEKTEYLTLAQTLVPEGVNKALIILIPAPKNPNGLVFQCKVQDLAHFKGGNSLYLNMTQLKVSVDLGKTNLKINPGETRIYDAPTLSEPVNMPIRYSYYHPEKQQWKILSASTIVIYPTRREICIFSWDPRFNRVDYHGITFPVM